MLARSKDEKNHVCRKIIHYTRKSNEDLNEDLPQNPLVGRN
jgi:hypothetical protein